jgi:hypothetical protein
MAYFKDIQKELKVLHLIFSKNEERIGQLERKEKNIKAKLGGELNG